MTLLGHKNIANTLIYTQLVEFEESDIYHSAIARNVDDVQKLYPNHNHFLTKFFFVRGIIICVKNKFFPRS